MIMGRRSIPSTPLLVRSPRTRLLALLACRDEMQYLPGYLANVSPHVDGIVALDDGSTDGSGEYLERSGRGVLEVLRNPPERTTWDEVGNYRRLVDAGMRRGAEWLVSLDADERVERGFRRRAESVIQRGGLFGYSAYAVRLHELWDSPDHYRDDGLWGAKAPPRLFRARPDADLDGRVLHAGKVPLQARRLRGSVPVADLRVYHLRMIHAADRAARRERYELADPGARFQPGVGYAYLTDERGLRLRRVGRRRGFHE